MDDSYVSKCSPESALGQNAYIVFYEKVHQEPELGHKSNPLAVLKVAKKP